MNSIADISTLYREFTDALAEILAENVVGPARRGRLARARAAVKRHPQYNEHEYFLAVEAAFNRWQTIQTGNKTGSDSGKTIRFARHRLGSSDDSALRTFDWLKPNCRAIRDGVTPALNAARTAFI